MRRILARARAWWRVLRQADRLEADMRDEMRGAALATLSVLLLSAAGMHALMSLTVAQRTREIGIRAALGAHPRRLLLSVFGRVLRQLAIGVAAGSFVSGALMATADLEPVLSGALMGIVAATMAIAGVGAAFGPARRSLRVQVSEALRQ